MKSLLRLLVLCLCGTSLANACEVWITSVSHRDNVTPTVVITADTNCTGSLQIYVDGQQKASSSSLRPLSYPATLSTTQSAPAPPCSGITGCHRIVAQVGS